MGNPFTLTFGKKPTEYITRRENIEEIKTAFLETPARNQIYLISGVRGSGKTVLLTALSKEISDAPDWISVDLNSTQNLLEDLSYRLQDACESVTGVIDRGVNISVAGFGVGIGGRANRDSVSHCESILEKLKRHNKKLLITIDEVYNDKSMKQFASQFQIWIRKEYPIFLLMTGLHENINAVQNSPQLTFLLRSPKIMLGSLGIASVARQYESALKVSSEKALELAKLTKGYAFAFQALGMLYYDDKENSGMDALLRELDGYLDEYVYRKIWSSLSEQDQKVLLQISDDKPSKVKTICDALGMTSSSFSKYRERLRDKGIIISDQHGYVELALPRFRKVCEYYL